MYLVTLLIRIAPITVREVNVAINLCHHPPNCISTFANNVGVVCVAHVFMVTLLFVVVSGTSVINNFALFTPSL